MAGHDQVDPGLGEDVGRGLAAPHLAGHRRADHLNEWVVTGQDPKRPDRGLAQGLGGAPGLVEVNDAL